MQNFPILIAVLQETDDVCAYELMHNGTKYILIDIPGFDDGDRPDNVITELVLTWLKDSLIAGQRLNGVVHLHRITSTRMGGTALRNNRMFRKWSVRMHSRI